MTNQFSLVALRPLYKLIVRNLSQVVTDEILLMNYIEAHYQSVQHEILWQRAHVLAARVDFHSASISNINAWCPILAESAYIA